MNKLIKLGCIALAGTLLFSCETDPEKLEIVKPYPKSDQYYADLRDYKNSDHEIVFGWFGNWSATGASASNYMKSLPDSIDMVGLWGGWQTITEAQRKDMEDSQHKRGLKVIATSLFDGFEMGVAPDGATAATEEEMLAYWGWEGPYRSYGNDNLTEGNIAAIQRFAHAFCQRIIDWISTTSRTSAPARNPTAYRASPTATKSSWMSWSPISAALRARDAYWPSTAS